MSYLTGEVTEELIDRCARAWYEQRRYTYTAPGDWDGLPNVVRETWLKGARVILGAATMPPKVSKVYCKFCGHEISGARATWWHIDNGSDHCNPRKATPQ